MDESDQKVSEDNICNQKTDEDNRNKRRFLNNARSYINKLSNTINGLCFVFDDREVEYRSEFCMAPAANSISDFIELKIDSLIGIVIENVYCAQIFVEIVESSTCSDTQLYDGRRDKSYKRYRFNIIFMGHWDNDKSLESGEHTYNEAANIVAKLLESGLMPNPI